MYRSSTYTVKRGRPTSLCVLARRACGRCLSRGTRQQQLANQYLVSALLLLPVRQFILSARVELLLSLTAQKAQQQPVPV